MKRERFEAKTLWIETSRDWNGRYWIAWKPDVSLYFRDRSAMVKWLSWPKGTPTRTSLDSWLESLAAADQEREAKRAGSDTSETVAEPSLSDEVLATGFGPECHLDETDPNYQTKTVI
jgi:hypothetical protein